MEQTLAQRLKQARTEAKLTQEQLAKLSGVSQTDISKIEKGKIKNTPSVIPLALALRIDPVVLQTGEPADQKTIRAASNVEPANDLKQTKGVPVVGEVKGGQDGYIDELQYPTGHGDGFVDHPTSDANAYALRVRGDSMHPRYRAGEYIVIEPSIEPQTGDDVVVSLTDGRKMRKELNWLRDGEVQLLSVNNHYGPLTLQTSDVLYIHLVAGRARRSAFNKGKE